MLFAILLKKGFLTKKFSNRGLGLVKMCGPQHVTKMQKRNIYLKLSPPQEVGTDEAWRRLCLGGT